MTDNQQFNIEFNHVTTEATKYRIELKQVHFDALEKEGLDIHDEDDHDEIVSFIRDFEHDDWIELSQDTVDGHYQDDALIKRETVEAPKEKIVYDNEVFNAVAISDIFHTNLDYDTFYKKNCDKLGGSMGVYDFVHKMARYFTIIESNITWGETTDHVFDETIYSWVSEIITNNNLDYEAVLTKILEED